MADRLAALAELLFLHVPPKTHLRDAVWGDLPLGARELALLDTPPFQRLRRVQQLGFTSLVFPGAHHTRFEHSIGVFHLTRRALTQLLQQNANAPIGPEDVRTVLAAALLHDVGHYPYSHAVEELEHHMIRPHEAIGVEIVRRDPIAALLRSHWNVSPDRVARIIARGEPPGLTPSERLLRDLLNGAVDTDKLDYLVRDAHHCRVPYGIVDVDRLIRALHLWERPGGDRSDQRTWKIVVDEHGIGPLQSLIFAKYLMFYNVYWHHAARIATVMFLRALQDALDRAEIAPDEVERADDTSILTLIAERLPPDSSSAVLVARLRQRHLYKRGQTIVPDDPSFDRLARLKTDPARRRAIEREWCTLIGKQLGVVLAGHEVLVDVPEGQHFDVPIEVLGDEPTATSDAAEPDGGVVPWSRVSGLSAEDMARYHGFIRRIRVVAATPELAAAIRMHWPRLVATLAE